MTGFVEIIILTRITMFDCRNLSKASRQHTKIVPIVMWYFTKHLKVNLLLWSTSKHSQLFKLKENCPQFYDQCGSLLFKDDCDLLINKRKYYDYYIIPLKINIYITKVKLFPIIEPYSVFFPSQFLLIEPVWNDSSQTHQC